MRRWLAPQQLSAGRACRRNMRPGRLVLREPDRVAFMTAVELARAAAVSEATVIRFAVSLRSWAIRSSSASSSGSCRPSRRCPSPPARSRRRRRRPGGSDRRPRAGQYRATFDALDLADVRAVAQLLLAGPRCVWSVCAVLCLADYVAYQLAQILPTFVPSPVAVWTRSSSCSRRRRVVVAFPFPAIPARRWSWCAPPDAGQSVVAIMDGFGSPTATVPSGCCAARLVTDVRRSVRRSARDCRRDRVELSRLDETRALAALKEFERRATRPSCTSPLPSG